MQSIVIGDLLQTLLLRVRPYEAVPGSANALYERWNAVAAQYLAGAEPTALGAKARYRAIIRRAVREFDRLERRDIPRKPRVGIVGEILVKFHPDANNNVVDVVEAEGCEASLPGLMEFVLNGMYSADWNYRNLGTGGRTRLAKRFFRALIECYRTPASRALKRARTEFAAPGDLPTMMREASVIASIGNQAGEGWLLTAEILELIGDGVTSIICAQPFACLPNHVTGKGMFREPAISSLMRLSWLTSLAPGSYSMATMLASGWRRRISRNMPLPVTWLGRQANGWAQMIDVTPSPMSSRISAVRSHPSPAWLPMEAITEASRIIVGKSPGAANSVRALLSARLAGVR